MPSGGARVGAGRPKGTSPPKAPVKRPARPAGCSAQKARKLSQELGADDGGLTPLAYLVGIMRNPKAYAVDRIEAAKACMPYMHPRLGAKAVPPDSSDGVVPLAERIKALQRRDAIEDSGGTVVEMKSRGG